MASVALGGMAGSLARYELARAWPPLHGLPVATLAVNLSGAFLLGVLLESLALAGQETPRLRWLRLTFGTGVLGGFTTYSSFALELRNLLADGRAALALGYAAGSIVGGLAACFLGVAVANRLRRGRGSAR